MQRPARRPRAAACKLDAPAWQPNHAYKLGLLTDAKIGDVVKPTVDNDFWYVAKYTTESFYLTGYWADGSGRLTISPS